MNKKELLKLVRTLAGRLNHKPEKEHKDKSVYTRKVKHKEKVVEE